MHDVALIALDGSVVFDLGIPPQVFGAVVDGHGLPRYRVRTCSIDGAPVQTSAGYAIAVEHDLSIADDADTVIVTGGDGAVAMARDGMDPRLADALHAASKRGARVMSICTGAFALAAAGLLDGRRATTHWRYADEFRRLFPAVKLDADVLFVDDGVLTSAGVAAGLDLCLEVVRMDFGAAAANTSARRAVTAPQRPGGQAQFIERQRPADNGDRISSVLAWANERLAEPLPIGVLARRAAMSERTLTRHIRAHTGSSPASWITSQRLALARELLEQTDLTVEEVARASGLRTGSHLRDQFQRRLGQTPTEYRRLFQHT